MEFLPLELTEKIYSYLDDKNLISFSLTSKKHRSILIESYNILGLVKLINKDYKFFIQEHSLSLPMKLFNVNLSFTKINDLGLLHLKGVHKINLSGTKITDAGLKHLKGVHTIDLYNTNITDAGLVHLKGVHTINLGNTKITDAGLVHLKGVHTIDLRFANITKKGKEFLKKYGTIRIF